MKLLKIDKESICGNYAALTYVNPSAVLYLDSTEDRHYPFPTIEMRLPKHSFRLRGTIEEWAEKVNGALHA